MVLDRCWSLEGDEARLRDRREGVGGLELEGIGGKGIGRLLKGVE